MKRQTALALCVACAAALAACQPAPSTNSPTPTANSNAAPPPAAAARTAPPTDLQELARRLVTQSAGVKEGDVVLISGGVRDMELLENLAVEVRKAGGDPLLTVGSDRLAKKSYAEVPEKYDSVTSKVGTELARFANVTISVDNDEAEDVLAGVPRARIAARGKAGEPIAAEFLRRKVRGVEVGNGLYPTEWRARRFEMPQADFAKTFWDGVNVDYAGLQSAGDRVKSALAGNELHITHPNGTDLKVSVQGRPVLVSDGIVSDDDVAKGAFNVYLPAGEVMVAPVEGSGSGKFVIDKTYFEGKEVTGLTMTFEGGKLTSLTGAGPGFEALKADYDARGAGKELLGVVDLGINPNIRLAPASKLGNWVSAGMVTVGTGSNTWAGGTNNISYGLTGHLPGATVKLDGKVIVENGALKV